MASKVAIFQEKDAFFANYGLRSENSMITDDRRHFIPKKPWRKYNAVSMNGESPN